MFSTSLFLRNFADLGTLEGGRRKSDAKDIRVLGEIMMIFDTNRLMEIHFQLRMIIYDLRKIGKKIKYFCDAGPKSDARGDEKQGIYFVWPYIVPLLSRNLGDVNINCSRTSSGDFC